MTTGFWPWGLRLGRPTSVNTNGLGLLGSNFYRTDSGIYLRDTGHGDSRDDALLYSGQGLDFDGVDDYVDTGTPPPPAGTVFGTIRLGGANVYNAIVGVDSVYDLKIYFAYNKLRVQVGLLEQASVFGVTTGQYYRVAVCYGDNVCSCYIDGVLVLEFSYTHAPDQLAPLYVGATNDFAHGAIKNYFDGILANVQVWSKKATVDDVAYDVLNCYRGDVTVANRTGTEMTLDDLELWLPLADGTGSVARDWSGNHRDGTLVNFATDDSQWSNAAALTSPLVIQTALTPWAIGNNKLTFSDDLTASAWSKTACTISSNAKAAPDGTTTMDGIVADATDAEHPVTQSITTTATTLSAKMVVAAGNQSYAWARVKFYDATPALLSSAYVSVYLPTPTATATAGTDQTISGSAKAGSGLVTISLETAYTGAGTVASAVLEILPAESDTDAVLLGDASTVNIYVWRVQLVEGTDLGAPVKTGATAASLGLIPIEDWYDDDFKLTRDYDELNFNGRSNANAGHGADTSASTALIIEMVYDFSSLSGAGFTLRVASQYKLYCVSSGWLYYYINSADGVAYNGCWAEFGLDALVHVVAVYDSATKTQYLYKNGVQVASSTNTWTDETLAQLGSDVVLGSNAVSKIPMANIWIDSAAQDIIDGGLADWVAARYSKAQTRYGV